MERSDTDHLLMGFPQMDQIAHPDKLCWEPPAKTHDGKTQDYLVFFISGNPGMISFYEPFLTKLHSLRAASSAAARFHICGHSYRGFETSPTAEHLTQPLSLEDQIRYQEKLLYEHVERHTEVAGNPPKVILVGHSVGAYVLLEIISRHQRTMNKTAMKGIHQEDPDLIGGILLFPTIADIAKSPLGKVAKYVLRLPGFAILVGALAKGLVSVLPKSALMKLVKMATKFPDYAAIATASFIKSPIGVRQALHLAKDEMQTITRPKWQDEVWGAATSPGTNQRDTINSNIYAYWGEGDKWVANKTRDEMVRAHGELLNDGTAGRIDHWKPVMKIDKHGIPHDFCTTIHNSEFMASEVNTWIDGIIAAHDEVLLHER